MVTTLGILKMDKKDFKKTVMDIYQKAKNQYKVKFWQKWEEERTKGKCPCGEMWLTKDEIKRLKQIVKSKERLIFIELSLLFAFLLGISYFLLRFFKFFFLPR